MKKLSTIFSLLLLLLISCTNTELQNNKEKEIEQYLNNLETEYERICKLAGLEVWEYFSDTNKTSTTEYRKLFSGFLLNDTIATKIRYLNSEIGNISNDTLSRRLELWNNIITCAQVDFDPEILELQNKLEPLVTNYPAKGYSDNEIEESVLQLIKLRNFKARQLGYGNYAYMALQNSGIDTTWLEELIYMIDTSSVDGYNNFIQNHFPDKSKVEYNDLREYIIRVYLINNDPIIDDNKKEELINSTLTDIGINISQLPIQFIITDLPPGIGGFGNCIDIPNDFRAVAMKELSFYYLLHEIGHGLQWTNVSTNYPVLKGYEWCLGNLSDAYCESMAEVVAKFSLNRTWLKNNGFTDAYIDSIRHIRKELNPVYLRLNLINTLFEIEIYKNPGISPATIKSELYRKYFNIERDFTKKPNLIRLQYVSYPVYLQNYLIADIISWQVHEYLEKRFGKNYVMVPEVGDYLISELWKDGELYTWQERIKKATGKDLDIEGYLGYMR